MSEILDWNGLPAISINKEKLIVFTNINEKFSSFVIPYRDKDNETYYNLANEQGAFRCLYSKKKTSDELTVVLSLTERCNSHCRYCFLDAQTNGKIMTKDIIEATVNYAFENSKNRSINFAAFGGEPGTQPELIEYLIDCVKKKKVGENKDKNIRYSITTNGVLSEKMLKILIQNRFIVSLSMDGIREVQNYQRPLADGKESFDLVCQNIKKLLEAGLSLKIRATVTQFSVEKMAEAVKMLGEIGVKKIHFGAVTPGGRGDTNDKALQAPTAKEFAENLIRAIEQGNESNVDVVCFPYLDLDNTPVTFCDGTAKNRIVVTPEGIISSCVEVQSKSHFLYDALNLGYYDEKEQKLIITREERGVKCGGCNHFSTAINKENCKTCPFLFFCGGGCATRNYRGSGDSSSVDAYRCEIVRRVMPYVLERLAYATYDL